MGHQKLNCPKGNVAVIQGASFTPGYIVPLKLRQGECELFLVNSIIDSGSPVSLIRQCKVENFSLNPIDLTCTELRGINGVKLEILGTIEFQVLFESISVNVLFYVTSNDTTSFDCLLSRDFISNESICVSFKGRDVIITPAEIQSILDQISLVGFSKILNINYVDPNEIDLKINNCLSPLERALLVDVFNDYYHLPTRPEQPVPKYSMKIRVQPNHTPFYFKPHRLSFDEKNAVQELINTMLNNGIIKKK